MKIIAIRIRNLASLEGTTAIEFDKEPLQSAGIFAITGPTGAGKSTILDALCLALYGKTPRYVQARETGVEIQDVQGSRMSQGDVRGILRDGTSEGYAEVDFLGMDKHRYRANWSVRRARNRMDGSIQADTILLRNLDTQQDFPGKKSDTYKEIERLLGLNFEQFNRSVLLAQGDFTAFLKAAKDEKASLLEKLTGTAIYSDISRKIYERYKQEETALRELQLKKEAVKIYSEEEIGQWKTQQAGLENELSAFEKQQTQTTAALQWYAQYRDFERGRAEAEIAAEQALKNRDSAADRRLKMLQVEQVQITRSWLDALKETEKRGAEKAKIKEQLEHQIHRSNEQKQTLKRFFEEATTHLAQEKERYQQNIPLLEKVRGLDIYIDENQKQLDRAQKEYNAFQEQVDRQKEELLEKQQAYQQRLEETQALEQWRNTHTDRKAIAENSAFIFSSLQSAKVILDKHLKLKADDAALAQETENKRNQLAVCVAEVQELKNEQETLINHILSLQQEISDQTLIARKKEKEQLDKAILDTLEGQKCFLMLDLLQQETEAMQHLISRTKSDLADKEEQLKTVQKELPIALGAKELSEKIWKAAHLRLSDNVETLRESLRDAEPCPVCGSTHHPYRDNAPAQQLLSDLEKSHLESDAHYRELYSRQQLLEQMCSDLKQRLSEASSALELKIPDLELVQAKWMALPVSAELQTLDALQKKATLAARAEKLNTQQAALHQQLASYEQKAAALDLLKQRLEKHKEALAQKENEWKDIRHALELQTVQQENLNKKQAEALLALDQIQRELDIYFKTSHWIDKWKAAPDSFLTQLENFSRSWVEKTKHIENNRQQLETSLALQKELARQVQMAEQDRKTKQSAVEQLLSRLKAWKTEQHAIFEGRTASAMEQELQDAIQKAQQQQEAAGKSLSELEMTLAKFEAQVKPLQEEINTISSEAVQHRQKLNQWLEDYRHKHKQTLALSDLENLLNLDPVWIEAERESLHQLDKALTQSHSVLQERVKIMKEHAAKRLSEQTEDLLRETEAHLRHTIGNLKKQLHEIAFQLKQDQENKTQVGDLLQQMRRQTVITEDWARLNEVIGAADGKKFRQMAQEYTLDMLLNYANIHLETLAARYKIQRIPGTLGLQVVDQYMGDEIRTVYSLSGGESFLVSLALALGLSSLSSHQMTVESLFIDEGFGALDPNTLHIAMDALERLHHQGRKVGVISHVQEMTERIPVQIKVSKMSNGKSKVEVSG